MNPYNAHLKRQSFGLTLEAELMADLVRIYKRITVMDLLDIARVAEVASHATLHKAIKDAEDLGLIDMEQSKKDKRVRYCKLTVAGKQYFRKGTR